MCGRVVESGGPLRYAFVDGMNVRDSRVSNYPPRWNAAPSQELLVIRRNHQTGQVALDPLRGGLIPYWRNDPPRWSARPGRGLLVIGRNHQPGQVALDPLRWELIPYWCNDPTG